MRTITLNTIKVTQPIGELFITKIDQATLWEMSKVDRRHITNDDEVIGVQRELKADKIRQIKKYLTTINATFPNSIILNVNRENLVESIPLFGVCRNLLCHLLNSIGGVFMLLLQVGIFGIYANISDSFTSFSTCPHCLFNVIGIFA